MNVSLGDILVAFFVLPGALGWCGLVLWDRFCQRDERDWGKLCLRGLR